MNLTLQLILSGAAAGSLYALFSLGLSFVYTTFKHFHIAAAASMATAGYTAYIIADTTDLPVTMALAIGLVVGIVINVLIGTQLYPALEKRGAEGFVIFLASLGAMTAIVYLFVLIVGSSPVRIEQPAMLSQRLGTSSIGITVLQGLAIICAIAATLILRYTLTSTQVGKRILAYTSSPNFAELIGINTNRLRLVTYAYSGVLFSLPGLYVVMDTGITSLGPENYFVIGIMCTFVAGLGNWLLSAIIGGSVGVIQYILLLIVPAQWTLAIVFGVFLLLLTFKTEGFSLKAFRSRSA